jgi:3-phytase
MTLVATFRVLVPLSVALYLANAAPIGAADVLPFDVPAFAETEAVQQQGDAADDAEIWRNEVHPEQSRIFATDKKSGLMVLDLTGKVVEFFPVGRLNNVDLRTTWTVGGESKVLVAASDRTKLGISFFVLDPKTLKVTHLPESFIGAGLGDPYGMCLYRSGKDGQHHAFVIGKDGEVRQFALTEVAGRIEGKLVRSFAVGSIAEGCVADDRTGHLYIAEEMRGIWRYGAEPEGLDKRDLVAAIDGVNLVADIEGLTLALEGETGGHLVASVQGNSTFGLFSLPGGELVARFRVAANAEKGIDEVTGTDGIAVTLGNFGADFPEGLLVVQDDDNSGAAQNFKFVSWAAVRSKIIAGN